MSCASGDEKHDGGGRDGCEDVIRVANPEHGRTHLLRIGAEHEISERAAAERRHKTQHDDTDEIDPFSDGGQNARDSSDDDAEVLQVLQEVVHDVPA